MFKVWLCGSTFTPAADLLGSCLELKGLQRGSFMLSSKSFRYRDSPGILVWDLTRLVLTSQKFESKEEWPRFLQSVGHLRKIRVANTTGKFACFLYRTCAPQILPPLYVGVKYAWWRGGSCRLRRQVRQSDSGMGMHSLRLYIEAGRYPHSRMAKAKQSLWSMHL